MGTLLYKQLNSTFTYLQNTLPLALASRVVAANVAATDIGTDPNVCTYYVSQSGIADVTPICDAVDFSNPNDLELFMNVTWFPADTTYYDNMVAVTGFTSAEWDAFMDTTTSTTSFGYV